MHKTLLVCSLIILSSCAAQSVVELRKDAKHSTSFNLDKDYQFVYRTLLNNMQKCMGVRTVGGLTYYLAHNLNVDKKEASISFILEQGSIPDAYLMHIDIRSNQKEKTTVNSFLGNGGGYDKRLDLIPQWAKEEDSKCYIEH